MEAFSFAAWTAYCRANVRPQHDADPEQLARLVRLLDAPGVKVAWRNLANDLTPHWPAHLGPLTWQEALHNVIGILISPPSTLPKPDTERDKWIIAARAQAKVTGRNALPLMPATRGKENDQRNWVALYLKTWIIPSFFAKKHYEEIATLVDAAWGSGNAISADQVRLLRPLHFRRPKSRG